MELKNGILCRVELLVGRLKIVRLLVDSREEPISDATTFSISLEIKLRFDRGGSNSFQDRLCRNWAS